MIKDLKIRKKTRMPPVTTLFSIVLESLASGESQEKELKCLRIRKENTQLVLFIYDIVVYRENTK